MVTGTCNQWEANRWEIYLKEQIKFLRKPHPWPKKSKIKTKTTLKYLDSQTSKSNKWVIKAMGPLPQKGIFPMTTFGVATGDSGQGKVSERAEAGPWKTMGSSFWREVTESCEVTSCIAETGSPSRVPSLLWTTDGLCFQILIASILYIGCVQGWRRGHSS